MIRITTANENRELDRIADQEYGIDVPMLMENAGRAAASALLHDFPGAGIDTEVLVFAGKGNNAGDAFVVARRLLCLERKVRIFTLCPPGSYKGASRRNLEILERLKAKIVALETGTELASFFEKSNRRFTIVDGILGTGLKGDLEGLFYDVVQVINKQGFSEVVALDIPSGVNGDTGAVHGASIQATLTVSFGFPKVGHFLPPGASRRGQLVNVDISLPPRFRKEGDKFLVTMEPIVALLKDRDQYGHKNSFGHTLLIGGSPGLMGAIAMSARAAHRMGTGLVTIASWEDCIPMLAPRIPDETMVVPIVTEGPAVETYKKILPRYTSLVLGPGLGKREKSATVIAGVLEAYRGPIVLDADALNVIATNNLFDHVRDRRAPTVLTPHPGEMARLLGVEKAEVLADPIASVRALAAKTHGVVLLKGACTIMGTIDNVVYLNHYPNDGMATAGSGDVLAGMIGGLLGQELEALAGTRLGVYLHSLAGALAADLKGHRSMTASDIIDGISNAFLKIKKTKESQQPGPGAGRVRLL